MSGIFGPIYWTEFSWEAFAALFTGVAAVGGAIYIGKRQTKIAERQTELLAQQAASDLKLRQQTLRMELLERRADVLSKFRPLKFSWDRDTKLSHDEWKQLYYVSLEAQLLYPKSFTNELDEAMSEILRQNRNLDRLSEHESDYARQELRKTEDRLTAIIPSLLEKMIAHTRIFDWDEHS